ncbi:MAG TPA: cyclase family protein, partial [Bacillota bacterium]|nr:cyclase family protein [Bacillota bacterium]
MQIFDISMSINPEMPVYKNKAENKPVFQIVKNFGEMDSYESCITMNMHTGTHLDCPHHMLADGGLVGELDLNQVIRRCSVWDFTGISDRIT